MIVFEYTLLDEFTGDLKTCHVNTKRLANAVLMSVSVCSLWMHWKGQ